ncbi:MAG: DMT family transporter [Syntrophomonadaceae bacterium]
MPKRTEAELSMLLVAILWGSTFVIVKNSLEEIGPFLFLGIRFILAFLFLAILSWRQLKNTTKSTLYSGSLLGIFLGIGYAFQTVGLKYTTSSNTGFITGLSVVLVPIIYLAINRLKPGFNTVFTVLLAFTGLFLLSFKNWQTSLSYGDMLVLVSAFGFAFHVIFVDLLSYNHNAMVITSIQILFVGLLCLLLGVIFEPWPEHFSISLIASLVITSIFATSLAFLLQNSMQKYSTPTRFAVILTTEPVFAALTGYLWANETFTERTVVGALLILVAMLSSIISRKGSRAPVRYRYLKPLNSKKN